MISEERKSEKLPCIDCEAETFWRLAPEGKPRCFRCHQKLKQDSLLKKQTEREEDLRDL